MELKNKLSIIVAIVLLISIVVGSAIILDSQTTNIEELEKIEMITIYSTENQTKEIPITQQDKWMQEGWSLEPVSQPIEDINTSMVEEAQDIVVSHNSVSFSETNQEELMLLAKTIHAEASDTNYLDRCYVGAVVMNRVDSGYWGNSVYSVITAHGQYACYGNSKFNKMPPDECIQIAQELLAGERYGVPNNVIFQAGFEQGIGVWKIIYNTGGYNHYYCYGYV